MNLLNIGFLIAFVLTTCFASNILVMLPMPMYSHTANFMAVFRELAKRGHNVTVVSPFPQKKPVPNLKDIIVRNIKNELFSGSSSQHLIKMKGWFSDIFGFRMIAHHFSDKILQEETVQNVIKDTSSSYDLIITETFFGHEPFLALGHKYSAPVVSVVSGVTPLTAYFTGNHFPTSYVPIFKFPMSDQMTFLERAKNTLFYILDTYGSFFYYIPKQEALMRKYFVYPGSENIPPLTDLLKNTSLTLVETHLALRYPCPLQNNIIEVGGLNLRDGDKLPHVLQKFMDEAPHGVIYFSFGSHFDPAKLNENVTSAFFSALGKVKERVLMKWSGDEVQNKPSNIKISSWLPQASLLGWFIKFSIL